MSRIARAVLACGLAAFAAAAAGAGPAGAATVSRPLPASDYSVKPLCGEPEPGEAACFALKLVPQTAAARKRATPIGMTLHRGIEPQSAAAGSFGLRPQDLHSGYALPAESPASQTIAIVDAYDDPTAEADLAAYDAEFGLPECTEANGCFRKVNQSGSASPLPAYNSEWAGEIALDVETVHAVCQNCHILLVEGESAASGSLETAENTAVGMGATEVSNSFGSPEPASEGSGYDHPGVVIAASTGDDGYLNWSSSSSIVKGHPSYPASSPDVVAVGGTRLSLNGGARVGEAVWNDGSTLGDGYGAGGGGCSEGPSAQAWQSAVEDWAAVGCGTKRAAADVGAVGDPFTGLAVYSNGHWSTVGGTSLAAPVIAATFALAGGSGGVSFPAQTVYGHLGSAGLFDVTEGSNGECAKDFDSEGETAGCTTAEEEADCDGNLICKAGVGYDGPTGVGTPSGVTAFAPPAPSVSEVSPSSGDLGAVVTIGGEHLEGVASVKFGDAEAIGIEEISATQLKVTAPGHAPGAVDVTVTTGGGTSATGTVDRFTYLAEPAVSKVEPAKGPSEGGASVTIRGELLGGATAVSFGGVPATDVVAVSEDEVTARTPAHIEGTVNVTVTTPDGISAATALDRYTYVARPSVSAVEPGAGTIAGGTAVTIRGTNLTGASAVDFGATAATGVVEASPTELRVTSPASVEGSVDVTVTTPGGTSVASGADEFQYLSLPVVTAVAPAAGPLAGGAQVTITGHDLGSASAVHFGATAATELTPVSATELTAISPANVAGAADVTVTTPVGTSNPEPADRFAYVASPTLVSAPAISGYPMEGRTLSASPGSWSNEPTAYAYRWLSCDSGGASCAAIGGATAGSYRLEAADVGRTIRVEVTAGNAGGQASEVSPATAVVLTRSSHSFTWTGSTPLTAGSSADAWTTTGNWEGGTAPGEAGDIGTLTLPSLAGNPDCAEAFVETCYFSRNDIAGIGVEKIATNDRYPYILYGEPFTLGSGGIEAVSNSSESNTHVPSFRMPITLGADQSWSVEGTGDALGFGGLEFAGSIGGESRAVHMELKDRGSVDLAGSPDDEVGPVTIEGVDPGKTGIDASENGLLGLAIEPPQEAPRLNADDGNSVHLKDVATIGAGTLGPLTVEGGQVDVATPFPEPGNPFGTLAVNGSATFDSASDIFFFLGGGTTPGDDFSQLTATGNVDLGGAELVTLGEPFSSCPNLTAGSELPLVSTTGRLEGTFAGVPDGSLMLEGCGDGPAPVLRIEYTAHSVTATSQGEIPFDLSRPSVSGTAIDEQTLNGHAGAWANEPSSYTYQWERCDASGNGCSPISGATSQNYTLTPDDAGDTVRLEATAHNAAGEASSTSAPIGPVVLPLPYNIAAPAISGSLVEGQTIGTTDGSWWYSVTGYTYQWERCPVGGGGCTDIPGATDPAYTLTSADVGNTVNVVVTARNATGQTAMGPYFRTSAIEPRPPANTGAPTISGSPVEGQILSAASGAWERPSYYTYQWLRCDPGVANCSAIGGASGPTYLLGASDVGGMIEVRVTAHNGGGEASATSAHTEVVLSPAPTYFGLEPSISGVPVEGNVLSETAGIGSWSHNPSITYQWLDCDPVGNGCAPIAGAVNQTYAIAAADVGHSIRVEEIGTNGGGHASVTSFYTGVAAPASPVAIDAPAITGSAVEGQQLSASQGSWAHNPYSFSYVWLRCDSSGSGCAAIPGSTGQSYVLGAADVGHEIEVEVVATNAGDSGYSTSSPTAVVSAKPGDGGEGGEVGGSGSGGGSAAPSAPGGGGGSSGVGGSGPVAAGLAVAGAKAPAKGGKAAIALRCTGSGPCSGALTLQVASGPKAHRKRHPMRGRVDRKGAQTIGRASFSIPAGGHETVSVHLSGKGQALVRKAGKKGFVAQLAGTDIASRQLELQAKG
jgi:hypothetical protein